jgi:hypothetical protein
MKFQFNTNYVVTKKMKTKKFSAVPIKLHNGAFLSNAKSRIKMVKQKMFLLQPRRKSTSSYFEIRHECVQKKKYRMAHFSQTALRYKNDGCV